MSTSENNSIYFDKRWLLMLIPLGSLILHIVLKVTRKIISSNSSAIESEIQVNSEVSGPENEIGQNCRMYIDCEEFMT
jgi:hypothetical protein